MKLCCHVTSRLDLRDRASIVWCRCVCVCVCIRLADSILGFASVNCGGPLFIAPGCGSLRGPKQKTKLNPFGFQK
jgi:hypothetical protein